MFLSKIAKASLLVATCAFLQAGLQAADFVVSKGGGDKNPSVLFKGVTNNPQMSAQVESDLKMCGWFEVVSGGSADYVINGNANANSVALNVANAAGVSLTQVTTVGESAQIASHKAVDAILKALFKVDGVCSTKITFSAEVAKGMKEIYVCDFDGTNYKKVTNDHILDIEPVWTPDGNSIVYCGLGNGAATLIEHNLQNDRSRRLAQFPGYNGGGRISPNMSTIALVLSKDGQLDLYTRAVNGTDLHRLTNDKAVDATPCWSPDGSKLCFVSDGGNVGRPNLFMINAGGGGLRRLPGAGSENVSPCWSKDNRIAYSAKVGSYALAVMDLSGNSTHLKGVVVQDGDWKSPSWAPDNRHVVCSHNGQLWVADTWLGKTRCLVRGSNVQNPDWSGILYR